MPTPPSTSQSDRPRRNTRSQRSPQPAVEAITESVLDLTQVEPADLVPAAAAAAEAITNDAIDLTAAEPAAATTIQSKPSSKAPNTPRQRAVKASSTPQSAAPTKPRWTDLQVFLMLDLVAETKALGDPIFEKGSAQKAMHMKIASRLNLEWPDVGFDQLRVSRKLDVLLKTWKTFLALINRIGTSYDNDLGKILYSDEQWDYMIRKLGALAKSLRCSGLPGHEHYEQAFKGTEEVGLTAVEAGDVEGLESINAIPEVSGSEAKDESDEEEGQQSVQIATPASGQSPQPERSSGTPSRKRRASATPVGSVSMPPKRPHRAVGSGSEIGIGSLLSTLVASRQNIRAPRAGDLAVAIADIQSRFYEKASEDQIDVFTDWIEINATSVIRYISSSARFKERLFWKVVE